MPVEYILFMVMIICVIFANTLFMTKYLQEMQKNNEKSNKELEELISTTAKQLIDSAIVATSTNNSSKAADKQNAQRDLMNNTFVKLRDSINEACGTALTNSMASRLAVYLFHNGSHSTQGINFFKVSCICEKILPGCGIKPRIVQQSNLSINLFDTMTSELLKSGKYIIFNNDAEEKIFISNSNVKYAQAISLFDKSNNLLGFILAEFEHNYNRDDAAFERDKLEACVNVIAPALSFINYNEVAKMEN